MFTNLNFNKIQNIVLENFSVSFSNTKLNSVNMNGSHISLYPEGGVLGLGLKALLGGNIARRQNMFFHY